MVTVSPDTEAFNCGSGFGAGPPSTAPVLASKREPWHGQSNSLPAGATVHPWWVQTALKATTVPLVGCATTIGVEPSFAETAPPTGIEASDTVAESLEPPGPEPVPEPAPVSVPPPEVQAVSTRTPAPSAVAPPMVMSVRRLSGVDAVIQCSSRVGVALFYR